MSYKTYGNYKRSENMWIGDIPIEWDLIKSKHCFKLSGGYAFKSDDFVDDGVCLIRIGDIFEGTIDINNCKKLPVEYSKLMKDFLVESGDVLIALTGATIGKIGQVPKIDSKLLLNQRIAKLSSEFSDYYKYILSSDFIQSQIKLISDGSAQENISNEDIGNFKIIHVDDFTKICISNFLDMKTSEIDESIAKNKELISLLEEKKTALINKVVTKGLDPNVPMKDSGIEWIGKIPEHWAIVPLKRGCSKITDGSHYSPETQTEGKYYITVRDVTDKDIDFENASKISVEDFTDLKNNSCQPLKGDVLLSKDGTIGKCVVVNYNDFVILSSLGLLRPNNLLKSEYLRYYLISDMNIKQMFSYIRGSAIKRLTINIIKDLLITLPTIQDQEKIINYLDKETSKMDKTIEKIQENIDLLEEYKTSLIHHAVTGKIDVRDEI